MKVFVFSEAPSFLATMWSLQNLSSQLGIQARPLAMKMWSPKSWTTRKFSEAHLLRSVYTKQNRERYPTLSCCRRGSRRIWRGKGFQVLILGAQSEGAGSASSLLKGGCCCCFVAKSCPTLYNLHRLLPTRLLHPWDFPGKNLGMGCHFFLQEIFPTQGQTWVSCIGRQLCYHWVTWDAF